MNRIISLIFALSLLVSCGQGTQKKESWTEEDLRVITVGDFLGDASPFTDQAVQISGTVVHVCRHGGQRLFIVGEDGEARVRITTGENIAEFDVALEGETIEVTGIARELIIDETYLAEWEAEVLEGSIKGRGEGHEGGAGYGEGQGDSHASTREEAKTADRAEPAEMAENPDWRQPGEVQQETWNEKESQLNRIQQVREEIAHSGKDHLSDYWIEAMTFKVIKE